MEYKYPYYSLNQPIVLGSNEFCKFTLLVYYITLHTYVRIYAVLYRENKEIDLTIQEKSSRED